MPIKNIVILKFSKPSGQIQTQADFKRKRVKVMACELESLRRGANFGFTESKRARNVSPSGHCLSFSSLLLLFVFFCVIALLPDMPPNMAGEMV